MDREQISRGKTGQRRAPQKMFELCRKDCLHKQAGMQDITHLTESTPWEYFITWTHPITINLTFQTHCEVLNFETQGTNCYARLPISCRMVTSILVTCTRQLLFLTLPRLPFALSAHILCPHTACTRMLSLSVHGVDSFSNMQLQLPS